MPLAQRGQSFEPLHLKPHVPFSSHLQVPDFLIILLPSYVSFKVAGSAAAAYVCGECFLPISLDCAALALEVYIAWMHNLWDPSFSITVGPVHYHFQKTIVQNQITLELQNV